MLSCTHLLHACLLEVEQCLKRPAGQRTVNGDGLVSAQCSATSGRHTELTMTVVANQAAACSCKLSRSGMPALLGTALQV